MYYLDTWTLGVLGFSVPWVPLIEEFLKGCHKGSISNKGSAGFRI